MSIEQYLNEILKTTDVVQLTHLKNQLNQNFSKEQLLQNMFELSSSHHQFALISYTNPEMLTLQDIEFIYSKQPFSVPIATKLAQLISQALLNNVDLFNQFSQFILQAQDSFSTQIEMQLCYISKNKAANQVLNQFCQAALLKPFQANVQWIETKNIQIQFIQRVSPEILQNIGQSISLVLNPQFSLIISELFNNLIYRVELKSDPVAVEFVQTSLWYLCDQKDQIAALPYDKLKIAIEFVSFLFTTLVNKKQMTVQIMIHCQPFIEMFINHESHYIFLQLLAMLQKFYEQRIFCNIFVLNFQRMYPEFKQYISPQFEEKIYQQMCSQCQLDNAQQLQFCETISYFNNQVLKRCLYFVNKQIIKPVLLGGESTSESYQYLQEDYQYNSVVVWQDWFAILKQEILSVVMKMTNIFPNDCVQFCIAIVQEMWATIYQVQNRIAMQNDEYLMLDAYCSFIEEVSITVIKLILNENEYIKTRMLNLEQLNLLFQFIYNSSIITEIDQNICLYRHITCCSEVLKFLQKFNQSVIQTQQANKTKKKLNDSQCQEQLFEQYKPLLKPIVTLAFQTLINCIDYRCNKLNEQDMSGELYTQLSQDTLALRRSVVTRLTTYFSCPYLVMLYFSDNEMKFSQEALFSLLGMLNELEKTNRITEKEIISVSLAKINALLTIQMLNLSNNADQMAYVNQTLGQILETQICYFSQLNNITSVVSFLQYFNVCLDQSNSFSQQIITSSSIAVKRQLKFKLNEAQQIIVKLFNTISDDSVHNQILQLVNIYKGLFALVVSSIQQQQCMSPEFVFQCNPLKINLMLQQNQHLQIDIDEPQQFITEYQYILEWLDSIFEQLLLILFQCGEIHFVLSTIYESGALLINYQKLLSSALFKYVDFQQHQQQIMALSLKYLQLYQVNDVYTKLIKNFNINPILQLLNTQNQIELIQQVQSQILVARSDLTTEQMEQISSAVYTIGLRSWCDCYCRSAFDSKTNQFEEQFIQNIDSNVLEQITKVYITFEQDLKCIQTILPIIVGISTKQIKCSSLVCSLVLSLAQNANQITIRELLHNVLINIWGDQVKEGYFDDIICVAQVCGFDGQLDTVLKNFSDLVGAGDARRATMELLRIFGVM
ncbi:Conserved_hypothetical protein [Hexamita inflata]|uniref:Uncharacterized protein n=1 Tax=Hexamita inflata TaxID=28002 RepID=A0AA86Q514_9EUKA|nr:Conserved hypothetical protein [Hexamita inflata]